ncbi:MAG: hypothetical protein HY231_03425 [Acidobacteria bacterium]|nr:hypothetical protein [Acidobacteriota bacterium]
MLRAEDGEALATVPLPDRDISAWLVFDKIANRPIVLTTEKLHLIAPASDRLEIEWSGDQFAEAPLHLTSISEDGRFLVSYSGYTFSYDQTLPTDRANSFTTFDLQTKTFRLLSLKARVLPAANVVLFHAPTNTMFVPYSATIKIKIKGKLITAKGCSCGTNFADFLHLGADGSLAPATRLQLPDDGANPTLISASNSMALSPSGALGFVSTVNKKIFSFDTMTGEIVNEETVPDNLTYLYYLTSHQSLLYANGTNKFVMLDAQVAPVINAVRVKKDSTLISGFNFLSGLKVTLNGEEVPTANRSAQNPGREIILPLGRKDLPPTQELRIEVTNRDGLISKPFVIKP